MVVVVVVLITMMLSSAVSLSSFFLSLYLGSYKTRLMRNEQRAFLFLPERTDATNAGRLFPDVDRSFKHVRRRFGKVSHLETNSQSRMKNVQYVYLRSIHSIYLNKEWTNPKKKKRTDSKRIHEGINTAQHTYLHRLLHARMHRPPKASKQAASLIQAIHPSLRNILPTSQLPGPTHLLPPT